MSGHKIADKNYKYDYIIAGAGCAGLSLAMHMIGSGKFADKKILIVDKSEKRTNDRTWCFWQMEQGLFEPIVCRKWSKVWFHGENFSQLLSLDPYTYKLIRSIDFYNHSMGIITVQPNFTIEYGNISELKTENNRGQIIMNGVSLYGDFIFNSILFEKPILNKKEHYLLQHFKGWTIETKKPVFEPDQATLMDFRTNQEHGTAFIYLMPFSSTKALVEYTLFTKELLQPLQYDEELKKYISQTLKSGHYTILEEEFGVIPMTDHKFPVHNGRIIYIGTAGGLTKPSTGYTFQFIQKHSAAIVQQLIATGEPFLPKKEPTRFRFYDSVLLNILSRNKIPGKKIFTKLFKKNKPQVVLRFLDNESSLGDEFKIISSLPAVPFLGAAIRQYK